MSEHVAPSLAGIAVLVTRPATQAAGLCEAIARHGGAAIEFPTIEIEPLTPGVRPAVPANLIVLTSANAVIHGTPHLAFGAATRFAAIGQATAAAARNCGLPDPIVPSGSSDSEGLLADPRLHLPAGSSVVIVRGEGGRTLLAGELERRGYHVHILEVYRRTRPEYDAAVIAALESRWQSGGIDIVTVTSVQSFENLDDLLTEQGRTLLRTTPLVAISERIATAARRHGHRAALGIAAGADDTSLVHAIETWMRACRGRSS